MTKRTSLAQVEAALRNNAGIPALAAKELGLTRATVYERIQKNPRLQAAIADIDATVLDAARGVVTESIIKGKDKRMVRWLLERKGAHLGFGTKAEVRLPDDQVDRLLSTLDPEKLEQLLAKLAGG